MKATSPARVKTKQCDSLTGDQISLIVGLGNPGVKYAKSRHNAGFWFLDSLQKAYCFTLSERRYQAETGIFRFEGKTIRVIAPQTFMNLSGRSVAALASFYRIPPQAILVAHDDLDLEVGAIKLKQGGGEGGHNGLKDMTAQLGSKQYNRLRIGIGRPSVGEDVSAYVLRAIPTAEKNLIQIGLEQALDVLPHILKGDTMVAMNQLHSKANSTQSG